MNKQQAIELVRKTFESRFDRDEFIRFLRELLNGFDDEGARINRGAIIPKEFQGYIEKMERVGKYAVDKNEIMLFIVHLKKEQSIERARTMQRNFVAHYLKMGDKDAALVAFVSPNSDDWRFSLVKMDYRFDEQDGKTKVREEFTPARRWSFLVGANEKSHTAQSKFVPIIEDDENKPTLEELEDAFNIEKVTKEFFEKYRDLFIRTKGELDKAVAANPKIKADFQSKDIDTVNLAKKLLGQIIFLYYLQKKGWFGVPRDAAWGEGSKNFLRELFEKKHGDYKNFFNDVLEHLFYDALRNDRSHQDHYFGRFNCKIPFLNGGLFDPMNNYDWVHTDILLPDSLFSNKNKTKEGDTGDGILDVFDRYNFTVKEDEPFEKEVAIDPELLGKAYEKFNAIRPDNYAEYIQALKSSNKNDEGKFNRQYGVFYTPREIVHYMCQQSLINYLYSELNASAGRVGDALSPYRDQAAETGGLDTPDEHGLLDHRTDMITKEAIALLIQHGESLREHEAQAAEKETKTYSPIIHESIRKNAALIDRKLAEIKICDPAVGSGAFPVGMMSEIVRARDVLKTWTKTEKTTYDFKRECIENSLYGVDIDSGAVEIAKLRLWLSLVVDEDDPLNIKPLPNLDYKVVCGNSLVGFPDKGWGDSWGSEFEKEIESLIHRHFNETNPTKKEQLKKQIDEKINARYKNSVKAFGYQVNFDFKTVFSEVFHQAGGFDIIIANPPYDVYEGDKESEIQTIKKMPIYKIAEGGKLNAYKLFLAKSVRLQKPNGILCEIFQNSFLADSSASNLRRFFFDNHQIIKIDSFPERDDTHKRVFESAKMSVCILVSRCANANSYVFTLNVWEDKYMTTAKTVNLSNTEILALDSENATIPSVNEQEMEILRKLALLPKFIDVAYCYQGEINLTVHDEYLFTTSNGYAPVIKGAAIQKWYLKEKMSQGETVYLDEKKYLRNNKGKKSRHHELDRIVTQGITGVDEAFRLKATYLKKGTYCAHSVNYILISSHDISYQYLLALLNSNLLNWFFKKYSTNSNVNSYEVNNLPIPKIELARQKQFIVLVDHILAAKSANPQADMSSWEREIDQMVYQLYGLTLDEIKIVEAAS